MSTDTMARLSAYLYWLASLGSCAACVWGMIKGVGHEPDAEG
jgi:hypothetical protein